MAIFQKTPVFPRICVGPARAMYIGPGLGLAPHINAAATIAVALDEAFELRTWAARKKWSAWRSSVAAVIPSQTLHHLKNHGPMAFLYLDPLRDRVPLLTEDELLSGRDRILAAVPDVGITIAFGGFGLLPATPRDSRIAKVVAEIERHPEAFGRMRDAAALAALSPSRFRARFQAEVGLPFRRYRLWRRMSVVMHAIASGGNVTEAALAAGFSSSAHLSMSFKRMFGLSVTDVLSLGVVIDVSEDNILLPDSPP